MCFSELRTNTENVSAFSGCLGVGGNTAFTEFHPESQKQGPLNFGQTRRSRGR